MKLRVLSAASAVVLSAAAQAEPINPNLDYDALAEGGAVVIVLTNPRPGTVVTIQEIAAVSEGGKSVAVPVNARAEYGHPLRIKLADTQTLSARMHSDRELPGYRKVDAGVSPYCVPCAGPDSFVMALPFSVHVRAAYGGEKAEESVSPAYLYYYIQP